MSLRDRTKKRLRWFLLVLVVIGLAGGIGYVARERHLEKVAVAKRAEGMRLLEAGDHFQAMHKIGPYLRRHPDDIETLFAYVRARQEVPEPEHKHISEALTLYRRVLSLDPKHLPAAEALLRLYQQHRLATEALQLSAEVLKLDPNNRVALEARTVALFALGRFAKDEALNAALAYNKAYPDQIEGQLLTLEILHRGDNARQRVLDHCAALLKQDSNDRRFMLLSGVAHATLGNPGEARKWVERASEGEMPDATSLGLLVEYADRLEMFDRSLEVLKRHGKRGGEFARLLTRRLWELERYKQVIEQVGESSDPQSAALRCIALHRLGRSEQAASEAANLRNAPKVDASAKAWAAVVESLTSKEKTGDAAVIAACQHALQDRKDAHLQYALAEAYFRSGDGDTAVDLWQQVIASAPGWSAPLSQLAAAAVSAGQFDDAARLAEAALARKPDNVPAMIVFVRAQTTRAARIDEAMLGKLLPMLDRVRELSPDEPAVEPLRVQALGLAGRKADAIAALDAAIAPSAKPSASALIHLASVSTSLHLNREAQCIQRCEELHGLSAELAFIKAKNELDAGRKQQAIDLFAQARSAAQAKDKTSWDMGWARLLDLAGDGRSKEAWIALADGAATDSTVQWLAMSARSVQGDRQFIGRVLERLRECVGDQGLTWRLNRARWLLSDGASQSAVEAALILNDLTRSAPRMLAPRILLADCLLKLGNPAGAIDQLTAAANLQPQSSPIALQLGRLLHSRGETARARIQLDRVLENPAATLAETREAASIVGAQGDPAAALAALERAYGDALKEPPADLLLAQLYRASGQIERTDAICKRLAESSDAGALAFVADFYAEQKRDGDAQVVLKKLESMANAPGMTQIILGTHALRGGNHAKAIEHFTSAIRSAPKNPLGWRQLIRTQVMTATGDAALATAREASAALPDDRGLAGFLRQAPVAINLKAKWPELIAMVTEMLDSPDEEQTVASVVELLSSSGDAPLSSTAVNKLSALASARPNLFPLQVLTARVCIQAGRTETACVLIRRAAQMRTEAMGLAVQTLASADRFGDIRELFRPKLKESAQWRIDWMRFAATALPEKADAVAWLDEIQPLVKSQDLAERLVLAEAWQTLAQRMKDATLASRAKAMTQEIAADTRDKPLTAEAALSLGCLHEAHGELADAEARYRKALELNPKLAVAQNNLAMLLARKGDKLEEALELATAATSAQHPNVVSFYDTLAFVQMQRKEYDAAMSVLAKALELKPDHLWCQVRRTDVLMQRGEMEQARAALAELEKDLPQGDALPTEMVVRLKDLRARLAQGAS